MDTNVTQTNPTIVVVPDINSYLKKTATELEAAFTLMPQGFDTAVAAALDQNILFLGDVSGSMTQPESKLLFMKKAIINGINLLPETAWFAVIVFSDGARAVVELCQATAANKRAAIARIGTGTKDGITAGGGTCMSTGLLEALRQHRKRPGAAGTCIMLTDGKNEGEGDDVLSRALEEFQAQARQGVVLQVTPRGVGDQFVYQQVKIIATATKGQAADYIADPQKLVADFAGLIEQAKSNAVTDVRLNVWMPKIVTLKSCKRSMPSISDLMGSESTDTTSGILKSFPLGAMNSEQSEYFIVFGLQPKPVGQPASAGKVWISYVYNGQKVETTPYIVKAEWTEDADTRSVRIPKGVARAKGDVELADNIEAGLAALEKGNTVLATQKLGAAAKIAHDKGDPEMTAHIAAVCDIQDGASGTVRLKKDAGKNKDATLKLEAVSVRTAKVK